MKIAHESPLQLLEPSRQYNDYDYALVHLFEDGPKEYYDFFVKSLEQDRKVILDNSIFDVCNSLILFCKFCISRIGTPWFIVLTFYQTN